MDPVEWSRCMANIFFAHGDPQGDLQKFRHFIPPFVLRTFCDTQDQDVWMVYDHNQMPAEPGILIIYKPEAKEFEKRHWSETFGAENIYAPYFDNLTTETWMRESFRKFEVLKTVDREIFNGLVDPIWQIHQQQPSGTIPLIRGDLYQLRKFLFLMTSQHSRDKTMHLLAHDPTMEDARVRRRKFIEAHRMEHPRDVWLGNAEQILNSRHSDIQGNMDIFDLDRENYRVNAKERFLVFWEAGPGEEFILTENAFGGFEGGQIGAKKNSQVSLRARELEQHLYTRDFMWHQLYVLSPTLVAALCHGTLMHPELTRNQRKRYGLRRSILEGLPHDIAPKYYKDMNKSDASFIKPNWTLPAEVERAFGANVSLERRKDDEILFPVQRLTPTQVALVNSVLLHNQQSGAKVKSVCCRSPPQYQSLYQSLVQFHHNQWHKYSEEEQNDYSPLTDRLQVYLNPEPMAASSQLQYAQQYAQQQQFPGHHPMLDPQYSMPVPDPRRLFAEGGHALSVPEPPKYEPIHVDMRPAHLRANSHSAPSQTSYHSSGTSSFAPSSQSSHGYSSGSSQSSTSTRTTSIDTPRLEPKEIALDKSRQSPTRKAEQPLGRRPSNSQPEPASRGSDGSGKVRIDKTKPKVTNTVPERIEILGERTGVISERGRQLDPPKIEQSRSKKNSPNPGPDRLEFAASELNKTRRQDPVIEHRQSYPKSSALPERPIYVVESVRPNPPERSRTDQPGAQWGGTFTKQQQQQQPQTQPQRPAVERMPQSSDGMRQRKYEIIRPSQHQAQQHQTLYQPQPQRPANERTSQSSEHVRQRRYQSVRSEEQQHTAHPPTQPQRPVERTPQSSDHVRRSQYQTVKVEYSQPQPQKPLETPAERKPQIIDTSNRDRGRQYEVRTEPGQVQRPSNPSTDPSRPVERKYQVVMPEQHVHAQVTVNSSNTHSQRPITKPDNSRVYHHVLKPEQPKQQPQAQAQQQQQQPQQSQAPPPPPPHQHLKPVISHDSQPLVTDEHKGRRFEASEQVQQTEPQRIVNSSAERTMRPGVEIVRPHVLEPTRATESRAQEPARVVLENPKMKHLRFETAGKTLTHKHSDSSLAGSMVVEIGEVDESQVSDGDEEESGDEEGSWEDEGFGELEELSKPRKPTVRFADRPLSRTGGRGMHAERPSSRLGRRVEIARPLSRNSQRVENARKPRTAHAHR
ncbi:unnamed protein product [Tuber aestivum]|uniref:Uncharacterized protein n=1 Tax=Tuber aestivum TaxID=59557 RepID=A0A292Q645_9PEZI|nr:unnamed protein product [Tuber aestivum]